MYNKKYIIVIKHYDCFIGNDYKEIVANSIKEVAEIKKSATFYIDYDHYQKIEVIQPQWVFERPTHQSGVLPAKDGLPWSSENISNEHSVVRDIKKDTFVDKDEYVFDNDDVVF
jgi:hypothetical protein